MKWKAMLLVVAILATSGCVFGSSPEDKEIEAVITAYYDAIQRDDIAAELSLWAPDRQVDASRQARSWYNRDRSILKYSSLHIDSTPDPNIKSVHYYLGVADRKTPEGKAAIMERVDDGWKFRELQ